MLGVFNCVTLYLTYSELGNNSILSCLDPAFVLSEPIHIIKSIKAHEEIREKQKRKQQQKFL